MRSRSFLGGWAVYCQLAPTTRPHEGIAFHRPGSVSGDYRVPLLRHFGPTSNFLRANSRSDRTIEP